MKLEVGMFVRFVTGFDIKTDKPIVRIGKIENNNECCITINVFSRQIIVSLKEFEELKRKEPSHNIIDLIEVGDYVNGMQVTRICFDEDGERILNLSNCILELMNEDIKTIVTKEQFSQMEYKVID